MHVAVIMDGNGRWALQRGLPRLAGHRAGVLAARRLVKAAADAKIARLTLYAFSSDNWRRPPSEVQGVFRLLALYLRKDCQRLSRQGIRLQVIGRRDRLPIPLSEEIERAEASTQWNEGMHLCIALDYSSRDAITFAAVKMAACMIRNATAAEELQNHFGEHLTGNGAQVDLLIRTGGEKRLSDFLLWESAYAELFFTNRMWPDFDVSDLEQALTEFRYRYRRFGGLPTPVPIHEPSDEMAQWRLRF